MFDLREEFKRRLAEKGWTQEEAAEQIGVSVRTIQHWLIGRNGPSPANMRMLHEKLGFTPNQFFGFADEAGELAVIWGALDNTQRQRLLGAAQLIKSEQKEESKAAKKPPFPGAKSSRSRQIARN